MFTNYFEAMKLIWKHPKGRATLKRLKNEERTVGPGSVIFFLTADIIGYSAFVYSLVCSCSSPQILEGFTLFGELVLIIVMYAGICFLTLSTISIINCFIQYLNFTIPHTLHELRSVKLIPADHGNSIGEIIVRLRNQPVEYNVVFDGGGNKLGEWTYFDPQHCGQPSNINTAGGVDVHNHPFIFSMAFSPADFRSAVILGVHKSIVVARDAIYILEGFDEVTDKIDPDQIYNETQKVLDALDATIEALYPAGGRQYFLARRNAWCGACQTIAQRYGLKFTAERFRDSEQVKAYRNSLRAKSRTSTLDQILKEKV